MYAQVGACPRCGAPRWSPSVWNSITPPPSYPSCDCFPQPRSTTTTTTNITFEPNNCIDPEALSRELQRQILLYGSGVNT